jgi:NADPH:quinone reductase-like Zn-dependent oxidoreductase
MMEHRFPLVIGKDYAGIVEPVGEGVDTFAVGDTVFGVVMKPFLGTGSLAQYVAVPAADGVARVPEGLSVRDAGVLGLAGVAALDSMKVLALAKARPSSSPAQPVVSGPWRYSSRPLVVPA